MIVYAIVSFDNEVVDVFLTFETAKDILNTEYNSDDELFPCYDYRIVEIDCQDYINNL